ncbi:MAG: ERCC4 domain-containing protein [candidate division KSB1 bacterium]|nr:ERCC4 domain-containing protein [candidate division KSB1 bacterium]
MQENRELNTGRKKPVHLIIDHREHASRLVSELGSCSDHILWKFAHLRCGDYLIEHKFIIERKTYPDFLLSLKSGHLFRQAYYLKNCSHHSAIVVESVSPKERYCKLTRQALLGALVHLKLIVGIPVVRTLNATETLRMFYYLGQQMQHSDFQIRTISPMIHVPGNKLEKNQRQKIKLLQMIPGVGSKKAMALLRAF